MSEYGFESLFASKLLLNVLCVDPINKVVRGNDSREVMAYVISKRDWQEVERYLHRMKGVEPKMNLGKTLPVVWRALEMKSIDGILPNPNYHPNNYQYRKWLKSLPPFGTSAYNYPDGNAVEIIPNWSNPSQSTIQRVPFHYVTKGEIFPIGALDKVFTGKTLDGFHSLIVPKPSKPSVWRALACSFGFHGQQLICEHCHRDQRYC